MFVGGLLAQRTITGTVTDAADGATIPGANVLLDGTTKGTITDFDGKFKLDVPNEGGTLVVSFMGYTTKTVVIGDKNEISIQLAIDAKVVDEVVVTAFGIKREKKALGYSVTDIKSDELTKSRDANVINSISGKVAGVKISQGAGGIGSSSRIVIRGNSSLSGNNQPLIVVDGVPIDNTNHNPGGWLGGIDYGSGISDINPDDIASMAILKGPNAAALYGSRAANGVILITTKKGKSRKGIGVTINSNTSIDKAYILLDLQNDYGHGFGGTIQKMQLPDDLQAKFGLDSTYWNFGTGSWGPKYANFNEPIRTWYDEMGEYKAQPDNMKEYFETGYTTTNSISLDGGNEKSTFRLSYTRLDNKGIKPNSSYRRHTLSFRGTLNLTEKIMADAKVQYVRNDAENREGVGDARTGARNFLWMPRNISSANLEKYYIDENGAERSWYKDDPQWQPNPYWASYKNTNKDNKDRIIASTTINYQIFDWLSLTAKAGTDFYKERRYRRTASYSAAAPEGKYYESWIGYRSTTSDIMLAANRKLTEDFDISWNLGGSMDYSTVEVNNTTINGFKVPDFYSLNNWVTKEGISMGTTTTRKAINSFFTSGQLAFRNYLFLDLTFRKDWSSTLPLENNSYDYPSVSASWAITDALGIQSDIFTFGKVRLSWAKVGNDADPYMLYPTYLSDSYGEYPYNYLDNELPLNSLKPEETTSVEAGGDFRFFGNKLGLDISVYQKNSYNQILSAEVSAASGYTNAIINAGELENKGIEALFTINQIELFPGFTWDLALNFSKNQNKCISLADDVDSYKITEESQVLIEARPGDPFGNIVGTTIKRNENGEKIVNVEGLYEVGERKVIGNITPDWTGGINNTFSYKDISLSFTIGIQQGGDIFSKTNKYGMDNGQFASTTKGRDSWYAASDEEKLAGQKADGTPVGYVAEGVLEDGTPNTKGIDPQTYFHQMKWGGIAELSVYDCSYIKLKDIVVSYNLPQSILDKTPFTNGNVSFVARNVWLISSSLPNLDPEQVSYSSSNSALGQEYAPLPATRSFGINLKLSF